MARRKKPILEIPAEILERDRDRHHRPTITIKIKPTFDSLPSETLLNIISYTDPLTRISIARCNAMLGSLLTTYGLLDYNPLYPSRLEEDMFIGGFPFDMRPTQFEPNPIIGSRDRPTRRRAPLTIGGLRPTILRREDACIHCKLCGRTFADLYSNGPGEPERTMLQHYKEEIQGTGHLATKSMLSVMQTVAFTLHHRYEQKMKKVAFLTLKYRKGESGD
jgi:hypothetical protein